MKVYTLIEDSKRKNTAFIAEHGLCLYFEQSGKRILFDTGASGGFIYNATLLGIDLSKVDICVISHAHSDHTGGLSHFLDINNHASVYMKSTAKDDYYIKRLFKNEKAGINSTLFDQYSDRITFIDNDTEVADGVIATCVNKYRHLPQYSSMMYKKQGDAMVKDDLSHELFIAVKQSDSIIVITGCSHHGIINIMMTAKEKFGAVLGVIGGFHLDGIKCYGFRRKKEPAVEIRSIAKYLRNHKIRHIYTGHCTGDKPLEKLEMLARAQRIYSGDIINIT